ncbi:hypothetical protein ABZ783_07065 [Micromonospora sp. NPDC047738]|uniref:hypothetical protein n=1 Tax=Micromonospora sp. NPDC047738 TaxID=3155741 RepID=UPI0033C46481
MTTSPFAEPPPGGNDGTTVLIMLARVEGKLDVIAAQHSAKLDEHARRLDDHGRRVDEVDDRVRQLEIRPTVTPAKMLTAVVGATAVIAAVSPFLDRLYS